MKKESLKPVTDLIEKCEGMRGFIFVSMTQEGQVQSFYNGQTMDLVFMSNIVDIINHDRLKAKQEPMLLKESMKEFIQKLPSAPEASCADYPSESTSL